MTSIPISSGTVTGGMRSSGRQLFFVSAVVLLVLAAIGSLALGPTGISLDSLPRAFSAMMGWEHDAMAERDRLVLVDIRLSRTILGAFVGAGLAVAGATMQGLFRNPLADPGLIGVSSGALLAGISTIAFRDSLLAPWHALLGTYALPTAAFFGALGTTVLLVVIASRGGTLSTATLLLAGIAIAALAAAGSGLIAYMSDDRELRDLTLWTMGSLSGSSWTKVAAIIPFAVLLLVLIPFLVRPLNGLLLGEAEAFHLGINVERAKWLAVLATAASVGAAVAVAGIVGFVGLVVPHLVRLVTGPDHRFVLPGSALLGAALVLFADSVARIIVAPAELPLGIVLAAVGAPVFLHLILKRGAAGGVA